MVKRIHKTLNLTEDAVRLLEDNVSPRKQSETVSDMIVDAFTDKKFALQIMIRRLEDLRDFGEKHNIELEIDIKENKIKIGLKEKTPHELVFKSSEIV